MSKIRNLAMRLLGRVPGLVYWTSPVSFWDVEADGAVVTTTATIHALETKGGRVLMYFEDRHLGVTLNGD